MMKTAPHPPLRRWADLQDGVISARHRAEVESHLRTGCGRCEQRATTVRRLLRALTAGALAAPPPALDRRVLDALVRALQSRPVDAMSEVLFGSVVLDQHLDCTPALRTTAADARRLLWTLGDLEVDASLVTHAAGTDLLGQFMLAPDAPESAAAGHVEARRGRELVAKVRIARNGRFTFRGLPPGAYVFAGELGGRRFALPRLVLA